MKSLCAKAPKQFGEDIRQALLKKKALNAELEIDKDQEYIYIPIKKKLDDKKVEKEFQIKYTQFDFAVLEKLPESYKEVIDVPKNIMEQLPTSFDVVGNIAVVKVSPEVYEYKGELGHAIMKANRNVATVAVDRGVLGDFRVRDLEVVAGRHVTETRHTEYGVVMELDLLKVYFSPRLATERKRVADMVEDGDIVIDMFTGVGPFSLLIAKFSGAEKIYSIDLNQEALDFLKKNIQANHFFNIEPVFGDAKYVVTSLEPADRVIMNLPFGAFDFLQEAFWATKEQAVIHYYEIVENDIIENRAAQIEEMGEDMGIFVEIPEIREVKTYSPTQTHIGLDINVRK
jgi:tRNA (guanine37-N1)-methyltransferase